MIRMEDLCTMEDDMDTLFTNIYNSPMAITGKAVKAPINKDKTSQLLFNWILNRYQGESQ